MWLWWPIGNVVDPFWWLRDWCVVCCEPERYFQIAAKTEGNWIILNIYHALCYIALVKAPHTQLLFYHSYVVRPKHLRMSHTQVQAKESHRIQNTLVTFNCCTDLRCRLRCSSGCVCVCVYLVQLCTYMHTHTCSCVCVWQVLFVCVTSFYCSFCSDACIHTQTHTLRPAYNRQSTHWYTHTDSYLSLSICRSFSRTHSLWSVEARSLVCRAACLCFLPYGAATITAKLQQHQQQLPQQQQQ